MQKKSYLPLHILYLHLAAFLFGGTALFSKFLPFSANDIILFRSSFSSILLLLLLLFSPGKLKIHSLKDGINLLFSGICFGVHLYTYFEAIQVSSVGIGVISLFTFPMITTLIEPFILKKRPELKNILLGICVLAGVFLIVSESQFEQNTMKGVGLGIISALSYSLRNLFQKYSLSAYSPLSTLFYQLLITFFIMLPFSVVDVTLVSSENYGYILLLTVVFTIIPHLAVVESLKSFDARSVSLILTLQVFYAIIFACFLYNEKLSFPIVAGGALVVFAVAFETFRLNKNNSDLGAK